MTTKKTVKKTVKKSAENGVAFDLPKTPDTWEGVAKASLTKAQSEAVKGLHEYKGFELWLAPFKTPDKAFRVAPKHEFFVIHIVTWGKKFIAKGGKTKVLQIAEIA